MIALEKDGPLWTVRLDRPAKANSLTRAMLADLVAIAEQAGGAAKALILTGEGRVFSAGADLDEARAGLATDPVWELLSGTLARLPCLTIAALNGTLAGGAFGMALACDIRLAVPDAKFFYPVMKLGFLPQPSDPTRLTALIGPARAKLILMSGVKLTAQQALTYGLIDEITDPAGLLPRARALCEDASAADASHVAAIKRMI
ncbi:enoyl-CoA hydratase/isomerase family protein [Pseudoruegeria sp. HB172150]|uniref:enoyl-CoA hydratase/isomerase family protein n=1 Tax=Pseudoruegeria sp. HB172150 TaxID=2721164 RepID=UPI001556D8C5|nr:enoyl-CoA hydratase/isomerase family protein [Pseudoruegeria sp. HB172150]